jgi:hypothetical protein
MEMREHAFEEEAGEGEEQERGRENQGHGYRQRVQTAHQQYSAAASHGDHRHVPPLLDGAVAVYHLAINE